MVAIALIILAIVCALCVAWLIYFLWNIKKFL